MSNRWQVVWDKGKNREKSDEEVQEIELSAHQKSSVPQPGGSVLRDYISDNSTTNDSTGTINVQGNPRGEPSTPRIEEQDYLTPNRQPSTSSPAQYPPSPQQSPDNSLSGGFFGKSQNVMITGGSFDETHGDRNVVIIHVGAGGSKEGEYDIRQRQPAPQTSISPSSITSGNIFDRQEQAAFPVQLDQHRIPSLSITEYSPDNSNVIYERHLKLKKRGFPLWIPGPNMLLPKSYRRKGVDIGDVGIITPSGGFSFLFNICLPPNDRLEINPPVLPEGFAPILPPIGSLDLRQFPQFASGSYLASTHIERIHDDTPSPGLSFKTSAAEGAILTLPEGAIELDLQNVSRFEAYAVANIETWYRYANGPRGLRAKNGEIRLVIGCDKATSWGVAAVANLTQHKTHHLKYRPSENLDTRTTSISPIPLYQWEYSGITEARVGPDLREIEELKRNDDSDLAVDGKYWNQSLFLRTLNITLTDEVFNTINEETKLALKQESESRQFRNAGGSSSLTKTSGLVGTSQESGAISGDERSSGSKLSEPSARATTSISPSAPISHPGDFLNKSILQKAKAPNIRAVVTQDKHWYSVITDDDEIMPNVAELAERVLAAHHILELDGIVYLESKDHQPSVKPYVENQSLTDQKEHPNIGSASNIHFNLPMPHKGSPKPILINADSVALTPKSDPDPPIHPPPVGGLINALPNFWLNAQPGSSSQWPPPHSTPSPLSPPVSTPAWAGGGYYSPAGTLLFAPQPQPHSSAGWGPYTPAGNGTGHPSGPTSYHPPTPYFTGQPPPSTPYEPASFTAHPTGWYERPHSAGALDGGGYFTVKKKHERGDDYANDDNGLGYSVSMKRTHSQGISKRDTSWGHVAQNGYGGGSELLPPPPYARGDHVWNENNLAQRPRDWRADFTESEGYLPQMPAMLKPTDVREWTDPVRREIHPLLQYRINAPPIEYDLRNAYAPFDPATITFPTLGRPHNDIDLAQLACQPAFPFMRLVHSRLPWYIDVHASHPNGVTVFDVFQALAAQLGTPIHGRHFWNEALSAGDRAVVALAFQTRCKERPELASRGVLQVDFLGGRCLFQGLARSSRGMWEIKTTRTKP